MKIMLSLIVMCMLTGIASAQPPRDCPGNKFGVGEGQFGDLAKMAEMRDQIRKRWQEERVDVERKPGPPPWAGMKSGGPRGPQCPFLGSCPYSLGPKPGAKLRGGDSKSQIPSDYTHNRGRGGKFDNKSDEAKRDGAKSKKPGSYNKGSKVIIINIRW